MAAKLTFSARESLFLSDAIIMPEKRKLFDRITQWMASMGSAWETDFGKDTKVSKVMRGENLDGQPWLVIDLPGIVSGRPLVGIRLLFQWGYGWFLQISGLGEDAYFKDWDHCPSENPFASPKEWNLENRGERHQKFFPIGQEEQIEKVIWHLSTQFQELNRG